jgi:GcrA cell cycle regulator
MSWTDERVELLSKLWNQGLSASQIAGELGQGITRNAVIGKVHRLGLSGRAKTPSSSVARPRKTTRAPSHPLTMVRGNLAVAARPQMQIMPVVEYEPQPVVDIVVPMSERVTIMELRESMCRWPFGDPTSPDFRFCGGESPIGTPYCAFHSKVAYQPSSDRRRSRSGSR